MVRQSELEELEQKWQADNERIMREHPPLREYDSLPPPELDGTTQPPVEKSKRKARAQTKPKSGPKSKAKPQS
jgi:sec-independent protein translocase protein TatB